MFKTPIQHFYEIPNKKLERKKNISPISIPCLHFKYSSIHQIILKYILYVSQRPKIIVAKLRFVKGNIKKGTYVTLLKVLMMTKHRVTRRTILAGTTSVGIRKLTHDITTNIAVGRYTLSKYGVTYLESRISNPYTE